jgi:hypothetical protein
MDTLGLTGLLILLAGLVLATIGLSQIGHHVNENEEIQWFWYLIIGIGVLAAILGGTILYQRNTGTKMTRPKTQDFNFY